MSDIWEEIYAAAGLDPNADTDGDGVINRLEALAGTDPFDPNSCPRITVSSYKSNSFSVTIACELGKRYELQSKQPEGTGSLTNWTAETSQIARTGSVATLSAPVGPAIKLFRMAVSDVDTDGDGLNDWEEYQLGLDPTRSASNNQLDDSGLPINDYNYAVGQLASQNIITIAATDPTCIEPDANQTAQDQGQFTVTRGGFPLNLVIINLSVGGSGTGFAAESTDFDYISRTVSLPPGVSAAPVYVNPLANTNLLTPVITKVTIVPGSGYTVGNPSNASVIIYPSQTPTGTGLSGQYYTNANATYTNAANFANLKASRTDANVDFIWNATNLPPTGNSNYFCVRWTGLVQPQYSETYFFVANTDDGVKLWVNDQLIINNWIARSSPADSTGSISLQAGVRYNIKMEYFQTTGANAHAHLSWYSASQPKQIIPKNRLYPVPAAPSAVIGPLTAVGFLNQPFSFTFAGANTATSLSASPMPPGLNFNAGTVSGTPALAGNFQIMLSSSNSIGSGSSILYLQVIDTGSSVVREVWSNVAGANISDIPVNQPASLTNVIGTLEGITNYGINYGERIRGFFTAPANANYYFWIAGNDSAELWISNDAEPANKVKRASANGTGSRQWYVQPGQKSGWLSMVAGQKYYLEILHKAGAGGNDNWSVGWLQDPSGTNTAAAGLVPGYLLSKYYMPPPSVAPGTLYVATMLAGNGVTNMPFGTATLRLSADNSQAILNFNLSGISSTITGEHIDNDPYLSNPNQIIFDISAAHPQPDGSFLWNIEPVGTFTTPEAVLDVLNKGKCYITILTGNYPDGELTGHFAQAEGSTSFEPPASPPVWNDDHTSFNAAVRFLTQATFGPNQTDIALIQSGGYTNWLNTQFSIPASHHLSLLNSNISSDPSSPYSGNTVINGWWQLAVTAPDQLRQRLAFALSEILVVSDQGVLQDNAPALCMFYDTLVDGAFGNFRDLLKAVTLTPAMGEYLNMQGNDKGNIIFGTHANENYAREILQLFSIGLYRVWPDGSLVMTSRGDLVSTYDQDAILGFAATFTGWNYYQTNQANGRLPTNFGPPRNYLNPMVLVPTHHDLNSKLLLDNVVLPPALGAAANSTLTNYDYYCSQDLEKAIDNIFYNQNVAPFICRQLIQRFVTSHPSPGYVYRVAQAFNNNGAGVRGDLQAVVSAILLDYEARSTNMLSVPTFGKQREPLLRATAAARAFPAPAPITATYAQNGVQYLTNTTSVPHRLGTNDVVKIAYTDSSGQPAPASQPYTVTWLTPTTFRVTPPGVTTATYTQTNTTISNMLSGTMVTTNIITVNLAGHGLAVGSSVYLALQDAGPYSLTNTTITNMLTSQAVTTNVIYLNIPGHGLSLGDSVSIHFTNNAVPDGHYQVVSLTNNDWFAVFTSQTSNKSGIAFINGQNYDRVYQVIWTANGNLFAVMTPDGNTRPTNNCLIPRITGGGYTVSGNITVNYSTPFEHGLVAGDSVYVLFPVGGPVSGQYQVTSVPDLTHFKFSIPSTLNGSDNGATVYPIKAPPLYRSGSATISWNTWSMNGTDGSLGQTPLNSPTVFNFFFPDYKFPGTLAAAGLTTPEFQLTSDTTVALQMNFIQGGVLGNTGNTNGLSSFSSGGGAITLDIGPYLTSGNTSNGGIPGLVDTLSSLLCAGQLSPAAKTVIVNYITTSITIGTPPTYTQMRDRVRAAVHLILVSPDYSIQR